MDCEVAGVEVGVGEDACSVVCSLGDEVGSGADGSVTTVSGEGADGCVGVDGASFAAGGSEGALGAVGASNAKALPKLCIKMSVVIIKSVKNLLTFCILFFNYLFKLLFNLYVYC